MPENPAPEPLMFRLPFDVRVLPQVVPVPVSPNKPQTKEMNMPTSTAEQRPKLMTDTVTYFSVAAGGAYIVAAFFLIFGSTPLYQIQQLWEPKCWPLLSVGYLAIDLLPLFTPLAASELGQRIDRYTWMAWALCSAFIMVLLWRNDAATSDQWNMAILTASTITVDGVILLISIMMRKALVARAVTIKSKEEEGDGLRKQITDLQQQVADLKRRAPAVAPAPAARAGGAGTP